MDIAQGCTYRLCHGSDNSLEVAVNNDIKSGVTYELRCCSKSKAVNNVSLSFSVYLQLVIMEFVIHLKYMMKS